MSHIVLLEEFNVESGPFRFFDLPFELRRHVLKLSVGSNRVTPKSQHGNFRTGLEVEPHDVTISATGLRYHHLTRLNLLFVNRQLRRESMEILFENASVYLQVAIPRYGGFTKEAASVSRSLNILTENPILCELAREVTVSFLPETAYIRGPLIQTEGDMLSTLREHPKVLVPIGLFLCIYAPIFALGKLASWAHRSVPFQRRHADIQGLVDILTHRFRSRKSLKIILYLDDLFLPDLRIILGLLKAPSCSITLEERWIQWEYPVIRERVIGNYERDYKSFVEAALKDIGYPFLSTGPSLEQFEVDETDDASTMGSKIIGKRQRTWPEASPLKSGYQDIL